MNRSNFKGLGVAMITPFTNGLAVDYDALANLTEHLISGGVNYLVVLGTTGESATLSADEKKHVFMKIKEVSAGRVPLVAGIGGNNTLDVIEHLKSFDFNGYDAVLSVSPYYNKPNQEGIYQHYRSISEVSPKPVIIYNVPGRTGSNMTAATQLRIAGLNNIIATKEASGNFSQVMEIINNKPDNFSVISGDDAYTFPFMALGMNGVISVIGNAYPNEFSKMVKNCLDGKWAEARKIHYRLLSLMETIFEDGSPGGIKVILREMGICTDRVRLPLANVGPGTETKLIEQMRTFAAANAVSV
ncbi:MAG: 4-hydroxy-tetrahydrodipicolinate synthase [Flavobacteriales bacterium]|nr:4-hydroxy-tetrahydrodipicolinate synthase [Flavobacteriales bacterium]